MSLLKSFFSNKGVPHSSGHSPETAPVKMNLEERMAFRRELLYEAIKVTMQANSILSASYKFRVVRNDKRGHHYAVMMDLSTDFLHNHSGQPAQLLAIGAAITRNAEARYGLVVTGVFWRINEQMQGFEKSRTAEGAERNAPIPSTAPGELTAVQEFERATADELAAFEAAWHAGQTVNVGDRIYASDLAPLGEDLPISGKGD